MSPGPAQRAPWDDATTPPDAGQREACYVAAVRLANACNLRALHEARSLLGGADLALLTLARWLSRLAVREGAAACQARSLLIELGLPRDKHGKRPSLRSLSPLLGIPRETLRRQHQRLQERIHERRGEHAAPDAEIAGVLDAQIGDFRWSAAAVRAVREARSEAEVGAIGWPDLHRAARACRRDELPAALNPELAAPESAELQRVLLAGYWLRWLLRVTANFGHDLRLALVLGEVAHYCVSTPRKRDEPSVEAPWTAFSCYWYADSRRAGRLRSCGTHSLALALDLPPETLRRKLHILLERGWIERDADGQLWIEERRSLQHFAEFNRLQIDDMIATAAQMSAVAPGRGG